MSFPWCAVLNFKDPPRICPCLSWCVQRDGKECALCSSIHGTSSDCNIPIAPTTALSQHTHARRHTHLKTLLGRCSTRRFDKLGKKKNKKIKRDSIKWTVQCSHVCLNSNLGWTREACRQVYRQGDVVGSGRHWAQSKREKTQSGDICVFTLCQNILFYTKNMCLPDSIILNIIICIFCDVSNN